MPHSLPRTPPVWSPVRSSTTNRQVVGARSQAWMARLVAGDEHLPDTPTRAALRV
ncbi:hypothetical protein [Nonomuraea aurantiaca]|uniref:hypothetical protein n=1 Tax=Nonomuraea aurantiaca TaxID=2878562 RepID=UPI001CD99249|nr:hypothetical protein [Nonomuraea aurantiaca]MCA2220739.1 hypothetical protein [Nonomuraea aurantiaca]